MKNIIITVVTVLALLTLINVKSTDSSVGNTYTMSAIVTDVKGNTVYLKDVTGNVWCVEDDTLKMYGRYIVTFDSVNTDNREDDVILSVE